MVHLRFHLPVDGFSIRRNRSAERSDLTLKVDSHAHSVEQVNTEDAVNLAPARFADGAEVDGRKFQVAQAMPSEREFRKKNFACAGGCSSAPRSDFDLLRAAGGKRFEIEHCGRAGIKQKAHVRAIDVNLHNRQTVAALLCPATSRLRLSTVIPIEARLLRSGRVYGARDLPFGRIKRSGRTCTKWQVAGRHIFWPRRRSLPERAYTENGHSRRRQRFKNETHSFVSCSCWIGTRRDSRCDGRSAAQGHGIIHRRSAWPGRQARAPCQRDLSIFERDGPACSPCGLTRPLHDLEAPRRRRLRFARIRKRRFLGVAEERPAAPRPDEKRNLATDLRERNSQSLREEQAAATAAIRVLLTKLIFSRGASPV